MNPIQERLSLISRRHFFKTGGLGLGTAALASLESGHQPLQAAPAEMKAAGGLPGIPHFAPKAKRAIYMFMAGSPSQIDTLDYKPGLDKLFDKDLPEEVRKGQRLTTMTSGQSRFPLAPSKFKFTKHDNGGEGAWVSELLPHTAGIVKDIAIVRSLWTEAINHDPAITYICTGNQLPGRASLGSWLSYGLGSMNENLPSFVVLTSTWSGRQQAQALYNRLWGSGFLASKYAGVSLRSKGDPVLFLSNPPGVSAKLRRRMLDTLAEINQNEFDAIGDPEIQTRISQYEMAFRMQTSVPELTDISKETKATLDMYGPEVHKPGTFAYHCLLARRMAERGVRFSQIFHRGWDQHANIAGDLPKQCKDIDQPAAALVKDLKQRGMLDDTLVVWGGEFGRTVYCQGKLTRENYGRDHHPRCFSIWMSGGGIKPGLVHGTTDDFSYNIVDKPVHIHEFNATILKCLGIDHKKLSYKFQGLDQRLTGVEDHHPVNEILA
ncbi:DUF1501 domain-containing protein [uncultured Gimesia sp.]|uniref:DUF1501 domain-containing protein n=1 Tax=uncultured Gimesia sp. TaxID=1678688 RepID=UPI0030D733D9|tara:strand:+ start:5500 stop:6975 length:1476 start_codon:yes stop_codon:yes gene_type:complete